MRWFLFVAALAVPIPASAGPCVITGLDPDVLTPTGAKIAKGGGVIVATVQSGKGGTDDASIQPAWRWKVGDHYVKPAHVTRAPGLTVYPLPAGATLLVNDARTRMADVVAGDDAKLLAAPKPSAARDDATLVETSHVSFIYHTLELDLAELPPDDAFALVIYGADGVARDWLRVDSDRQQHYSLSYAGNRCATPVPGRVATAAGDKLTFAWIDTSGRPAAMSAAIEAKP